MYSLPIPGIPKNRSMMNEPVTRNASVGPRIVTTGINALRIMCRLTTALRCRPLLWAVRM